MGRGVTRVTRALAAVGLLTVAATAHAQSSIIRVDDLRLVEGSSGPSSLPFQVRLTNGPPQSANVTVDYAVLAGSAQAGSDYSIAVATGTLVFTQLTEDTEYIYLDINGDTSPEWSKTLMQDEVFFIQLSNPSANAVFERDRATITLLDDDHPQNPGVQFLSVVTDSRSSATNDGRNRLQWRFPAAQPAPTRIVVAWTSGSSSCTPPASDTAGEAPGPVTLGVIPAGGRQTWTHDLTNFGPVQVPRVYCYSVFAGYPTLSLSERAEVVTKTFNSTSVTDRVRWTYTPGHYFGFAAPSILPPTVGMDAIYTVSTDGVVHAMQRGLAGGIWPPNWNPVALGKPAQSRSAVVPLFSRWRLFVGTDNGGVHAVDGQTGTVLWSRSANFFNALESVGGGAAQATPAGIFKPFGFAGQKDMLLVGTNAIVGSNRFYALDPATGLQHSAYTHPSMGGIAGMAVVDYLANRVYFGAASASPTFFALDLGLATPSLTLSSEVWNPMAMGGTNGSLVLRNNRVYFSDSGGQIRALHVAGPTPGSSYAWPTSDGEAKGFVWPDRRANDRLYYSTTSQVQAVRDNGTAFAPVWAVPLSSGAKPSIVLQRPGTDELYVGDDTGRLVHIDANTGGEVSTLPLATGAQLGAPSLDNFYNLVLVGSTKGVIYAVELPF